MDEVADDVNRWCDRFDTMPMILELQDSMEYEDRLELLGCFWTMCDKIGFFAEEVIEAMDDGRTGFGLL